LVINVKSSESIDNSELPVDDDAANIANVIPQKQIYFIIFSLCRVNSWFHHVKVWISSVN